MKNEQSHAKRMTIARPIRIEKSFGDERGSTTVIALLIMALVGGFVAVALARVTNEAIVANNDTAEMRTYYAAQASLETMTRNFNKIFDTKLSPADSDLASVQSSLPPSGFAQYQFNQTITPSSASQIQTQVVPISSGPFKGLQAEQDKWTLTTTVTDPTGAQVQLTRDFLNNRVPVFQFGVFKDWDLEFHPGPVFNFGGRVHSNGNIFLMSGNTLTFQSAVTAAGEVVTDVARNGAPATRQWNGVVQINDGTGAMVSLTKSSAGAATAGSVINGPDTAGTDPNMPDGSVNSSWAASEARFNGNLLNHQQKLNLPIKLGSVQDNREIIKRPRSSSTDYEVAVLNRPQDDPITARSRYANGCRTGGIRVSLADSKNELPGCNGVASPCGVQLDGTYGAGNAVGYQPIAMRDGYQATPMNGYRLYRGQSYTDRGMPSTRQTWIKVEVVTINSSTGLPQTQDVTSSFLSLGLTEPAASALVGSSNSYITTVYNGDRKDSRSIIKLQRFVVPGPQLRATVTTVSGKPVFTYSSNVNGSFVAMTSNGNNATGASTALQALWNLSGGNFTSNFYVPDSGGSNKETNAGIPVDTTANPAIYVVPFPIEMFDAREGVSNADDTTTISGYTTNGVLPVNGVMSVVDVDVANLKRLIDGGFDSYLPNSGLPAGESTLQSSMIPRNEGTILYVSDRRGDRDFDGEYDMEDIFGKYNGVIYAGEDVNGTDPSSNATGNGILEVAGGPPTNVNDLPYVWEGSRYHESSATPGYTSNGTWSRAIDPVRDMILTGTSVGTASGTSVGASSGNYATVNSDLAALFDHRYYRRVVRLINGTQPPGYTNLSGVTKGFTFASENGVYIKGNFNATGISSQGSPTAAQNYLPSYDQNGSTMQVPCSVVGDSIDILSNAWNDGESFSSGLNANNRVATETYVRTAVIAGSSLSFQLYDSSGNLMSIPNQGSGDAGLYGGVHNFLRFLENWGGIRLHYSGSLICFYTARNNNGAHKTGGATYGAPNRDWIFDASFLDPTRLPPGTPFFQYLQITGFRRTNY